MENNTIKLELTLEKANLVLQALAELPFRVSAELISEIRQQAQGQIQETPEVANDEAPAPKGK